MNLRLTDKKKARFSLEQNYFLGVVVSALAQLRTGAAVGCSGYSVLAVFLCFSTCSVDLGPVPESLEFIPA